MQRKAESARVARLRKKEYVSGLEAEIAKLKAELAQAKQLAQQQPGTAPGPIGGPTPGLGVPQPLTLDGKRQLTQMDELLKRPIKYANVVDPESGEKKQKLISGATRRRSPFLVHGRSLVVCLPSRWSALVRRSLSLALESGARDQGL